jgi:prolyl 4-hydroxylase
VWAKRGGGKTLEAFGRATAAENDASLPKGANPEGKPHEVKLGDCKDRHAQCVGFAKNDECVKNPGWMIVNCPRSCNACHLLDPKVRCDRRNLNMSIDPIYKPGDMLDMFQSIEANFGERYKVTVVSTDPYIVTFDDFLTDTEIDALITTVDGGWERSTDTGSANEFGEVGRVLSQGRTSSNAWCRAPCESNPYVQNILKKIGEVTRVPRENYESFQVLRYEIGQAYNPHHDASASQVQLACGPRILTFFLYLSDVEEGGETGFPQFGIKIKPKKGSALLWPSTLNDNPEHIDGRTLHQAHPVVRGTKFAANTWIHLYNFETPNLYGCTGTFSEL